MLLAGTRRRTRTFSTEHQSRAAKCAGIALARDRGREYMAALGKVGGASREMIVPSAEVSAAARELVRLLETVLAAEHLGVCRVTLRRICERRRVKAATYRKVEGKLS